MAGTKEITFVVSRPQRLYQPPTAAETAGVIATTLTTSGDRSNLVKDDGTRSLLPDRSKIFIEKRAQLIGPRRTRMNHPADINMRQRVGSLTAAIFGAAILALPREKDLPEEEIMHLQRQSGPQRDRVSDDRTESGKLSKRREGHGRTRRKTSIDRGVWQFNSGHAAAAAKVAKLWQEGESLPVGNHQEGGLYLQLPQAFKRPEQRVPFSVLPTHKKGAGIDEELRQARVCCHPLPLLLRPRKSGLNLDAAALQNRQNLGDARMCQRAGKKSHIEKTRIDESFSNRQRRRRGHDCRRGVQIPSNPQRGIEPSDRHIIILRGGISKK